MKGKKNGKTQSSQEKKEKKIRNSKTQSCAQFGSPPIFRTQKVINEMHIHHICTRLLYVFHNTMSIDKSYNPVH